MQYADEQIVRFADMLAAMGAEARLRIVRLLLTAHPHGMYVGDIQAELGISPSNLSHHLDKLRTEGLLKVTREGTYLRYSANTPAIEELLAFLYSECCTRQPEQLVKIEAPHRQGEKKWNTTKSKK